MTRTERNQYPAALLRDRHSRSGLTKTELAHKGGDGAHNWGSLRGEGEAEAGGRLDAAADLSAQPGPADEELDELLDEPVGADLANGTDAGNDFKASTTGLGQSPTDSISSLGSAVSDAGAAKPAFGGRRLSAVTDEEREKARLYRESCMHKTGGVDLAHIAKTSYGIQSPPAVSPTKAKNTYFGK
ncbi:hypothetical protein IAT38_007353 [Cryptococcus sp. DSM 104549]